MEITKVDAERYTVTVIMHLLGVHLADHKIVPVAIRAFYGIGPATATAICHKLGIHPRCLLSQLDESHITALSAELSSRTLESDLKREVRGHVMRLRQIGCYRGRRHQAGLPVRGQRTRTNAKTAKKLNGKILKDAAVGGTSSSGSGARYYSSVSTAAQRLRI